jgi:hypothetical protein
LKSCWSETLGLETLDKMQEISVGLKQLQARTSQLCQESAQAWKPTGITS